MTIPIATTTITIKGRDPQEAVDPDAVGYDPAPDPLPVLATGVRATISLPSFKRRTGQADQVDVYALRCDPVPNVTPDRYFVIIDETTGAEYEVDRIGPSLPEMFGLAHTVAYIKIVRGAVSGGGNSDSTPRE